MKAVRHFLGPVLVLLIGIATFAPPTAQAQKITRLEILPRTVTMVPGQVVRFTAVAKTDQRVEFTPGGLYWSATGGGVDGVGSFQAGDLLGTFKVMVRHNDLRAIATVRIVDQGLPPARVVVSPSAKTVKVGRSIRFKARAYNRYKSKLKGVKFVWQVSGEAKIGQNGKFIASAPGTFTITARDPKSKVSGSAQVTVKAAKPKPAPPPKPQVLTRLKVNPAKTVVHAGKTKRFSVRAYAKVKGRTRQVRAKVKWQATGGKIDQKGNYRAGNQPGTFKVSATHAASGKSAAATVTIRTGAKPKASPKPKRKVSLRLHPRGTTLGPGMTDRFKVRITGAKDRSKSALKWEATGGGIDQAGNYTAGSQEGKFQVKLTHLPSGAVATASVSVIAPAQMLIPSVKLTKRKAYRGKPATTRAYLRFQVKGCKIGKVTVHKVMANGSEQVVQTIDCWRVKNPKTLRLSYPTGSVKEFVFRLFTPKGKLVATQRRPG